MQKIVLTHETFGQIKGRLEKFFRRPFEMQHGRNENPLKTNWSKPGNCRMNLSGEVSKHPLFNNPSYASKGLNGKPSRPMILVKFSDVCADLFSEGDIFYFKGGSLFFVKRNRKPLPSALPDAEEVLLFETRKYENVKLTQEEQDEIAERDEWDRIYYEEVFINDGEEEIEKIYREKMVESM